MTAPRLERTQRQRVAFLRQVYHDADGGSDRMVPYAEVVAALRLGERDADSICRFLVNEGLLRWAAMGQIELTHVGLRSIEAEIAGAQDIRFAELVDEDRTGSRVFEDQREFVRQAVDAYLRPPPVTENIIYVEQMSGGEIRQATHDQVLAPALMTGMQELLAELRRVLSGVEVQDVASSNRHSELQEALLVEAIAVIDDELASAAPRRRTLQRVVESVQHVLEGAAGEGLVRLAPSLPDLLGRLDHLLHV